MPSKLLYSTPCSIGLCLLSYFTAPRAQMVCANLVTSQYSVLKWTVPLKLLHSTPCSNGLCKLSYFSVLRSNVPVKLFHNTPFKRVVPTELLYNTVLKWTVPVMLLHSTPCSDGLCQLSYFAVLRTQMDCAN